MRGVFDWGCPWLSRGATSTPMASRTLRRVINESPRRREEVWASYAYTGMARRQRTAALGRHRSPVSPTQLRQLHLRGA